MKQDLDNLKEVLRLVDEVTLLELLDLTTEELIHAFGSRINERYDEISIKIGYEDQQ